ncbi:kyphoscoliosis peptidase isoform X2 [Xenopus laevis]|uniref:Kyphoscoliosis peptidase isoform X2 n=1 Tax=Xenopus laevis TaxID=8355 RepID=A0A8J0VEN7_XENLA|nr:kyphoscoliosis peptidase isoform X2 [Xenopus laevis]
MALHHRLSLWQKILLGIFCFPLLPIYVCVYCLCLKDEEKESERNEATVGFQYSEEQANQNRNKASDGQLENFKVISKGKGSNLSFSNRGFKEDEEDKSQQRSATSAGQKENVQIPSKDNWRVSFRNRVHKEDEVPVEPKKKKLEDKHITNYRYPWDRTSLKSLPIDLKAFEKLDAYAAKVTSNHTVDLLVKELLRYARTDLEKTRAIWIWISHHIEYDTEGLKNLSRVSCDPNDVLRTGRGVCAGYSSLFERMCSIAGVQCKSVSGYSKGAGYKTGQKFSGASTHAWNMVYLEESWHLLDSTWGAGTVSYNGPFTFGYNEFYFLTHPALFIGEHFPEYRKHQLLEPCILQDQFEKLVHCESHFYNMGLLSSLPDTCTVETVKGKVSFTLEGRQRLLFLFHLNKTETPGFMQLTEHGMKLDVYPQKTGEQILQIFAKREDSEGSYDWILDYKIICKSVDTNMKIPKCLHNPVGPSWLSEKAGLFQPSHQDPVIYTEDGCCTVSFALKGQLDVFATLESDEIKMTSDMKNRHIFQTQRKNNVEFRVRLPTSGTYVLCVNVKNPNADTYTSQCEYVIICTKRTVHWPKFPLTYGTWAKHYELLEPLDGILPENSNISFKLRVPDVTEVSVREGKNSFPLSLTDQGYWEGICHTGATQELTVTVCFKDKPNVYNFILQYQVGPKK